MRAFFVCAMVTAGCSVDVGAGSIAPVAFDAPIVAVAMPPPISFAVEVEFLTADEAAELDEQYGSKLGAVDHVDVQAAELGLRDDAGAPLDGTSLSIGVGTVTIDHAGQRVRLPDDVAHQLVAAVRGHQPLTLTVHVLADWPPPMEPADAHALIQPIVVVNGLQAL